MTNKKNKEQERRGYFFANRNHCQQCNEEMNPVSWLVNPVCLKCAKKNHKQVIGGPNE